MTKREALLRLGAADHLGREIAPRRRDAIEIDVHPEPSRGRELGGGARDPAGSKILEAERRSLRVKPGEAGPVCFGGPASRTDRGTCDTPRLPLEDVAEQSPGDSRSVEQP